MERWLLFDILLSPNEDNMATGFVKAKNAHERISLTQAAKPVLDKWYEQCRYDFEEVKRVNALVCEVACAWIYLQKSGMSPDTSHWADNQRALWDVISKI
jgi:hypothetical protein